MHPNWPFYDYYWHWWYQAVCDRIWRGPVRAAKATTPLGNLLQYTLLQLVYWQPYSKDSVPYIKVGDTLFWK